MMVEKPFLRVARESFYQTTRNDSEKMGEGVRERGLIPVFVQILGSFKPFRAVEGGFGRPRSREGRNRSSGNGGKKAGFEAVFCIFGQKMRGGRTASIAYFGVFFGTFQVMCVNGDEVYFGAVGKVFG
jgi:hypothetical protein